MTLTTPSIMPLDLPEDPLWCRVWQAPAKLNLFLHVTGRRSDGYHLLETLFRFIEIEPDKHHSGGSDRLRFIPRNDRTITRARPLPGVSEESDLCLRAANLLHAAACAAGLPPPCGVTIDLEKRLPQGGGLGGGSSDAATVLLALNRLWKLKFSNAALKRLALELGADVPVFVGGRNAFAAGIGEELKPLGLPPAWYVVVAPDVAVPTAEIFRAPELKRDTPPLAANADCLAPGFGRNDLQPVAVARYPQIAACLAALQKAVDAVAPMERKIRGKENLARMTGSGACVFAELSTGETARAVLRELSTAASLPPATRAWRARGLPVHPLHGEPVEIFSE